MESRDIKDLHPVLAESFLWVLVQWQKEHPTLAVPFLTCTYRPNVDQDKLYAQGRTTKGKIVTHARAGQSPHNYLPSYAFDICFKDMNGKLDWNPDLFKKFAALLSDNKKIVWGGSWKFTDNPHFELTNWKSQKQ